MATIWVNTDNIGTEDGTTESTGYTSLATAVTNLPATSWTEDQLIKCVGTAADAASGTINEDSVRNGWFLRIEAARDAVGGDGFNDTNQIWSTSHYRIDQGSNFKSMTIDTVGTTVNGLQIKQTKNNENGLCIEAVEEDCTFEALRCIADPKGWCISLNGTVDSTGAKIYNNVCFANTSVKQSIWAEFVGSVTGTFYIYNNMFIGGDINALMEANGSFAVTLSVEFHNNVCIDPNGATADDQYDEIQTGTTGVTGDATYNAGTSTEPTDHDSNWQASIVNGTDVEDWTSTSGDFTDTDFRAIAGGKLDGNGLGSGTDSNVPSTDIFGTARPSSAPTIGPYELPAGQPAHRRWGGVPGMNITGRSSW